MKNERFKILQSYWFIGAVGLLLINDFILKDVFHNWFTGKLSDFAGVFFLPLFLAVIFPKRIKELVLASGLFFIYWKSPLSEGLIKFINSFNGFNYVRVVDYTDLIALAILPLAYFVYINRAKWSTVQVSPTIPFAIAGFAMMATSQDEHFEALDTGYAIPQNQTVLFNNILSNTQAFENDELVVRFNDSTVFDTMHFSINIFGGQISKYAYVDARLIKLDSVNSEIFFRAFNQTGGDCGFFRPRCREEYSDKATMLDELVSRFIDQL